MNDPPSMATMSFGRGNMIKGASFQRKPFWGATHAHVFLSERDSGTIP